MTLVEGVIGSAMPFLRNTWSSILTADELLSVPERLAELGNVAHDAFHAAACLRIGGERRCYSTAKGRNAANKAGQRLHKEDTLSPDEVAQPIDVSAEKAAQPVSRQSTMCRLEETPMTMDQ